MSAPVHPDAATLDGITRRLAAVEREARYSRHVSAPGSLAAEASHIAAHARRVIRQCEAVQRAVFEREAVR